MDEQQEIVAAKNKLRRYRVRQNFDHKYHDRGGLEQLMRMIEHHDTLEAMSVWFSISQSRLSVILTNILGQNYAEYLAGRQVNRSGVLKSD